MTLQLRPYQNEAIAAIFDYWASGGGNPLAELATGTGKSVIIAKLVRDVLEAHPDMRILCLVHVRELVEQNFSTLLRLWPEANSGIYSAGLGKRDSHHKITFASIQSVYKKARELGPRDLVLIDECHLCPPQGDGMYRTLLEGLRDTRPDLRVAGFTATPFRMGSGRLDQGEGRLFDKIVYSYGIGRGICDGWLSSLISKASATEIDVSSVARRGGEFVAGALEAAADHEGVTKAAALELVKHGADRKSWLIFCSGVNHSYHVRDALRELGVHAETITGETPVMERAQLVRDFRNGKIRCLTNAQVLTTGFDAPSVDLIAFLRPTLSTGLYLQMVGRGVRTAPEKPNCIVLDFAGNVRRHGPVDAVEGDNVRSGKGSGEEKVEIDTVRAKECPVCESLAALNAKTCQTCGHEWLVEVIPKHDSVADDTPILSTEKRKPDPAEVLSWTATKHFKVGAPHSLKVTYFAGLMSYSEWLHFERTGFIRDKAERWWARHGGSRPPTTVDEAVARFEELSRPVTISVVKNGKFYDIVGRTFAQKQHEVAA